MLDKIGKNAVYCLETLSMDVDNLENCNDFVSSAPKRKLKNDPCQTPVKRRPVSKKKLIEAAREAEEEIAKPSKVTKAAKSFVNDEAEEVGEDDADDGKIIA